MRLRPDLSDAIAAAVAGFALVIVGLAVTTSDDAEHPETQPAPVVPAIPVPRTIGDQPPPMYHARQSAPVRLVVPSLKIDAPVVPIALSSDAVLTPPSDYRTVGWWDASAEPGSHEGQTVITGHTVHTGGGAMDHLPDIDVGDRLAVHTTKGVQHYLVKGTDALTHTEIAKYAYNLFAQDRGEGRLILVTCTNWNGSFYERNEVVLAVRTTWKALGKRAAQRAG